MGQQTASARQGHRLIQIGMALFLGALLVGVAVPAFRVPRLGLSTHLLALTQGLFLMILGLFWERLRFEGKLRRIAIGLTLYGCLAPLLANVLAAVWGAGNVLLPLAAGAAHGSDVQEGIIAVLLRSGGGCLIGASGLILWGLRLPRGA